MLFATLCCFLLIVATVCYSFLLFAALSLPLSLSLSLPLSLSASLCDRYIAGVAGEASEVGAGSQEVHRDYEGEGYAEQGGQGEAQASVDNEVRCG